MYLHKLKECSRNKIKLQHLFSEFLSQKLPEIGTSVFFNGSVLFVEVNSGIIYKRVSLNFGLEEADIRIMPHVASAVKNSLTRVVLSHNDTDVVTLLL